MDPVLHSGDPELRARHSFGGWILVTMVNIRLKISMQPEYKCFSRVLKSAQLNIEL